MKTREELIAEMAVIGCVRNPQAHTMGECFECGGKYGSSCNAYRHAEKLHNAGYRKQSDTAREILDEVSQHFGGAWLIELYKKYGVEVKE